MRDALIVSVLSVLPRNLLASWQGWFARTRLSRTITGWFVRAYGLNMDEAEHPQDHYPTLASLFTRRLKPGARPIAQGQNELASPCDAAVAFVGTTENGAFDVAPGRPLTLSALLGERVEGERDVCVLYLSPKDYHRVHVPREGHVARYRYLPGTLWPVFPGAVARVNELFARNERIAIYLDTDVGCMGVVMVGAFGVGRMSLAFDDLVTNTGRSGYETDLQPAPPVKRGDDLGVFHLGSTVVLVTAPGLLTYTCAPGDDVKMGQAIATL